MVPDDHGRLAEGVLLEASVLGRVLGLRLLKLDMTVVLVPSRVVAAAPPRTRPWPRPTGRGLAEAARRLDEGAELLAATRRGRA